MTTGINDFLRGSKDAMIASAVRSLFNSKYGRFGQMTDVSVDTSRREIRVRLELVGESTPVEIQVMNYHIQQQGAGATLTIGDAITSREWLTELLRDFVIGRTLVLPERAAGMVKFLM
jgi:hypothetical protein